MQAHRLVRTYPELIAEKDAEIERLQAENATLREALGEASWKLANYRMSRHEGVIASLSPEQRQAIAAETGCDTVGELSIDELPEGYYGC